MRAKRAAIQVAVEAVEGQGRGRLYRPIRDEEKYEERALHEGQHQSQSHLHSDRSPAPAEHHLSRL